MYGSTFMCELLLTGSLAVSGTARCICEVGSTSMVSASVFRRACRLWKCRRMLFLICFAVPSVSKCCFISSVFVRLSLFVCFWVFSSDIWLFDFLISTRKCKVFISKSELQTQVSKQFSKYWRKKFVVCSWIKTVFGWRCDLKGFQFGSCWVWPGYIHSGTNYSEWCTCGMKVCQVWVGGDGG